MADTEIEINELAWNEDIKEGVRCPGRKVVDLGLSIEGFETWKRLEKDPMLSWSQYVEFMEISRRLGDSINGIYESVYG